MGEAISCFSSCVPPLPKFSIGPFLERVVFCPSFPFREISIHPFSRMMVSSSLKDSSRLPYLPSISFRTPDLGPVNVFRATLFFLVMLRSLVLTLPLCRLSNPWRSQLQLPVSHLPKNRTDERFFSFKSGPCPRVETFAGVSLSFFAECSPPFLERFSFMGCKQLALSPPPFAIPPRWIPPFATATPVSHPLPLCGSPTFLKNFLVRQIPPRVRKRKGSLSPMALFPHDTAFFPLTP